MIIFFSNKKSIEEKILLLLLESKLTRDTIFKYLNEYSSDSARNKLKALKRRGIIDFKEHTLLEKRKYEKRKNKKRTYYLTDNFLNFILEYL